jgi:hypothetical protein
MIRINDAISILSQAGYEVRSIASARSANARNGGCGAPTFRVYAPGSNFSGHQVMTLKQLRQTASSVLADW